MEMSTQTKIVSYLSTFDREDLTSAELSIASSSRVGQRSNFVLTVVGCSDSPQRTDTVLRMRRFGLGNNVPELGKLAGFMHQPQ
jgi:hypothetical protein